MTPTMSISISKEENNTMAKNKRPRQQKSKRPPQQLPPAVDFDFKEVDEDEEEQVPQRELLFKWKGEEYWMDAPDPTMMLEIMEIAATRSDIGAMGAMARMAIGEKNWRVLKSIPELGNEELGQVFERALTFAMGSIGDLGN